LQCVAVCCSVMQCVAVCCSVLQCVAVCCSVLQSSGVLQSGCCSKSCLGTALRNDNADDEGARIGQSKTVF